MGCDKLILFVSWFPKAGELWTPQERYQPGLRIIDITSHGPIACDPIHKFFFLRWRFVGQNGGKAGTTTRNTKENWI